MHSDYFKTKKFTQKFNKGLLDNWTPRSLQKFLKILKITYALKHGASLFFSESELRIAVKRYAVCFKRTH